MLKSLKEVKNEILTISCTLLCYFGHFQSSDSLLCFCNFYFKPDLITLQAWRFWVHAAMPGFVAHKLCPE